jgi:hypothetical protein
MLMNILLHFSKVGRVVFKHGRDLSSCGRGSSGNPYLKKEQLFRVLQRRSVDEQVQIAYHADACSDVERVGATKVSRLVTLASLVVRES